MTILEDDDVKINQAQAERMVGREDIESLWDVLEETLQSA